MASQQTRRIVWTGSIAAVTATGAWYGAGLKIKKEHKQVRSLPPLPSHRNFSIEAYADQVAQEIQRRREATPAEKIALLEQSKGVLIAKKIGLEKKIHELEMRAQGATREESMVGRERRR